MTARKMVLTMCPDCGDVAVPMQGTALVVGVETLHLSFQCPSCERQRTTPIDGPRARLLTDTGVPMLVQDTVPQPREVRSPHP